MDQVVVHTRKVSPDLALGALEPLVLARHKSTSRRVSDAA